MVLRAGYAENMCKFAYFPSRIMGQNRKDVSTDSDVIEMIQCSQEIESLNLYVVREDDPYLDDVLIGDDVEEEPEDDAHIDFYQNDYVDSDDSDDDDEPSPYGFTNPAFMQNHQILSFYVLNQIKNQESRIKNHDFSQIQFNCYRK